MNLPQTEQTPDDPRTMPPARRRRAKRSLVPLNADERETFLDELSHRVSPSFDFFLFSLLAGVIISVGLFLDAPALLVLGVLFAPTMAPIVGLSLGTITGSTRFFGRSFIGVLIASFVFLLLGFLTGVLAGYLGVSDLIQIYYFSQLTWHGFIVLAVGAVLTTIALVRTKRRVSFASVALSYELFIPLIVAGFGLGSGVPHLWPDGLVVFAIHLAWAALLGAITLALMGFRPLTLFGYTVGGVVILVVGILLVGLSGAGAAFWGQVAIPTPIPTATSTATITITPSASITASSTPVPPTRTMPPTFTASITPSPTGTSPASPTPVFAIVDAPEDFGGAILRSEMDFEPESIITSIQNGTLVEILSEKAEIVNGYAWLHVRIPGGPEGWMLEALLLAATPAPNW